MVFIYIFLKIPSTAASTTRTLNGGDYGGGLQDDVWRSDVGWSALDITTIVAKQFPLFGTGSWGIRIYFDPSSDVNVAPGSMTNYWEVRFTFTLSAPSLPGTPITSTPVGTANNDPVTYFISFVGYMGGLPSLAFITDVETRGDFSVSSEFIDLRVSVSLHLKLLHAEA